MAKLVLGNSVVTPCLTATGITTNDTLNGDGTTGNPLRVSANRLKRACCWKNDTTIGNGTLFSYNSSTQEETTTAAGTVVFSESSSSLTYIRDGKIYQGRVGSETQLGPDYSDWSYVVSDGYNVVGIRNGAIYKVTSGSNVLIDDTKNYTDIAIKRLNSISYVYAIADLYLYIISINGNSINVTMADDTNTYSKLFLLGNTDSTYIFFTDTDGYLYYDRNYMHYNIIKVGTSTGWTIAYTESNSSYTRGMGICNGVLKRTNSDTDYVLDNTEIWVDCVCSYAYGYAITQSGKLYRVSFTTSGATLTQVGTDTDWQKTSKIVASSPIFLKGGKVVSVTTASTPVVTEISSANTITKIAGYTSINAYWTGSETTTTTLRYTVNYPQVNDNTYINTTGTVGATITATTPTSINDGTLFYQRYTAGDGTFSAPLPTELNTQTLTTKQLIDLLEE